MGLCVQPNLSVALGTRPPIFVRTRPQPYGYARLRLAADANSVTKSNDNLDYSLTCKMAEGEEDCY